MLVVGSGKMQRPSCVFSRFFQVVSISALPAYNYVHLPESRVDGHKLHRINLISNRSFLLTSGKLHKDYTVYEDVKSILPIYIHVYPVRPCCDDLCEIIPSL